MIALQEADLVLETPAGALRGHTELQQIHLEYWHMCSPYRTNFVTCVSVCS